MHFCLPSTPVPRFSGRAASTTMHLCLPSRIVPQSRIFAQASSRQAASFNLHLCLPCRRVHQTSSRQEASSALHFSLLSRGSAVLGSAVLSSGVLSGVAFGDSKFAPFCSSRVQKAMSGTALLVSGSAVIADTESQSFKVAEKDLLIVGPGVLGRLIAQLWLKGNEGSKVVGQTNTPAHHEELRSLGIVPTVKDGQNGEKFPYVIFCAPPGVSDYTAEVRAAAQRWNGKGCLLFTSSSAVFDVSDNGPCNEESAPIVPKGTSPRVDILLYAEDVALQAGGNVLRLAGLYNLNRGAHGFYLKRGSVEARPDHLVNLIHYEDAATLCVAILKGGSSGHIYVGCDNFPVSRQDMMNAVNKSGKFEQTFMAFTSVDGPLGKQMNNSATRIATGWKPKYESFPSFLGVESCQ